MIYQILNKNKETTIASSAKKALGFFARFLGLMFKKKMSQEEALVFYRASSIHTFFMRFPIDIIFLDRQKKVKRLIESLSPWRVVICRGAQITIELPAGKIAQSHTAVGDLIEIEKPFHTPEV